MLHSSTHLIYLAIYILAQLPYLLAGGFCCPEDYTCSGCWMCPGSDLRAGWDDAIGMVDQCETVQGLPQQAECYCKGFSKIAKVWSEGVCCTEYAPTLAAATNVCNLAAWPSDKLTSDLLKKAVTDANYVRQKIWTNNSGKDVPKLGVYVKEYSSSTPASDTSSYSKKSALSGSPASSLSSNTYSHKSTRTRKHTAAKESRNVQHKTVSHPSEVKTDESYPPARHHAQRAHSKSNIAKRADNPLHKNASDLWKRSAVEEQNGLKKCGIDFQGVPYPDQVPGTVAKMFASL